MKNKKLVSKMITYVSKKNLICLDYASDLRQAGLSRATLEFSFKFSFDT